MVLVSMSPLRPIIHIYIWGGTHLSITEGNWNIFVHNALPYVWWENNPKSDWRRDGRTDYVPHYSEYLPHVEMSHKFNKLNKQPTCWHATNTDTTQTSTAVFNLRQHQPTNNNSVNATLATHLQRWEATLGWYPSQPRLHHGLHHPKNAHTHRQQKTTIYSLADNWMDSFLAKCNCQKKQRFMFLANIHI